MVIVTFGVVGVFAADVDDGVARCEYGGIAAADERRVVVGGEQAKEVDGEGLVGVEGAVVSANEGAVEFWAFGEGFAVGVVRGGHGCGCRGSEKWSRANRSVRGARVGRVR